MTNATCPATPVFVARSLPEPTSPPPRWTGRLMEGWKSWRELSRRRAELRALDELSDSTRRDIGLGERGLPDRSLWDHERGLW